jgi:hypothetical protein
MVTRKLTRDFSPRMTRRTIAALPNRLGADNAPPGNDPWFGPRPARLPFFEPIVMVPG